MFNSLKEKIMDMSAVVGVVGLGYVGLPMAVTTALKGFRTIGFDIQEKRANKVRNGENYIEDVNDDDLKKVVNDNLLTATSDYSKISEADIILIAVPTPLDEHQQPDMRYIINSANDIAKHAKKGILVVLESTTYPGTTEEVVLPIFEKYGFKSGEDLLLAFSPERVDPGNKKYKTNNTAKVIGGLGETANEISKMFYELVIDAEIFLVSSPAVAEMEKIYENTFRNINIALANEMAILCELMKIDIWEVIEAAKTKPYGFMPFYPGPGVGGHCIPIDPFYLTWKAREYNYHTRLIELSGEINNGMPRYIVEKSMKILNKYGKALSRSKILLLGMAYKKDIKDLRESPGLKLIELFKEEGAAVYYNDLFINEFEHKGCKYYSQDLNDVDKYDLIVVVTDHSDYDYSAILSKAQVIFDTRNAFKNFVSDKIYKL